MVQQFTDFNLKTIPIPSGSSVADFNLSIVQRGTRVIHDWHARYRYKLDAIQLAILEAHKAYLTERAAAAGIAEPITHTNPIDISHAELIALADQSATIQQRLSDDASDEDKRQHELVTQLAYEARRQMYHDLATTNPALFEQLVSICNLNAGVGGAEFAQAVTDLVMKERAITTHDVAYTADQSRYQIRIQPTADGHMRFDIMAVILKNDSKVEGPAIPSHLVKVRGAVKVSETANCDHLTIPYDEAAWNAFAAASNATTVSLRSKGPITPALSLAHREKLLQRCHATHVPAATAAPLGDDEDLTHANPLAAAQDGTEGNLESKRATFG